MNKFGKLNDHLASKSSYCMVIQFVYVVEGIGTAVKQLLNVQNFAFYNSPQNNTTKLHTDLSGFAVCVHAKSFDTAETIVCISL